MIKAIKKAMLENEVERININLANKQDITMFIYALSDVYFYSSRSGNVGMSMIKDAICRLASVLPVGQYEVNSDLELEVYIKKGVKLARVID